MTLDGNNCGNGRAMATVNIAQADLVGPMKLPRMFVRGMRWRMFADRAFHPRDIKPAVYTVERKKDMGGNTKRRMYVREVYGIEHRTV